MGDYASAAKDYETYLRTDSKNWAAINDYAWVLIKDKEYFLPYGDFPWFRNATLDQILNVQLLHDDHLYWPDLDVDLCLDILSRPEAFPLIDGGAV